MREGEGWTGVVREMERSTERDGLRGVLSQREGLTGVVREGLRGRGLRGIDRERSE